MSVSRRLFCASFINNLEIIYVAELDFKLEIQLTRDIYINNTNPSQALLAYSTA